MNTDRLLVIFGSAATFATPWLTDTERGSEPRDIDIICEGEFGPEELRLVKQWEAQQSRWELRHLPLDVKGFGRRGVWRGSDGSKRAMLDLPTPYGVDDRRNQYVVLRGDVDVAWYRAHALPARIRAASSVQELLYELRDAKRFPDGRMAVLGTAEETIRDFDSYTQGRVALKNAIVKCPFWDMAELLDPRARFVRWLAEYGVDVSVRREIDAGSQAGGGDGGVNYVSLDGIQLCYGRLVPWREALPVKRIRRREARANGRRRAMSVAPIC